MASKTVGPKRKSIGAFHLQLFGVNGDRTTTAAIAISVTSPTECGGLKNGGTR